MGLLWQPEGSWCRSAKGFLTSTWWRRNFQELKPFDEGTNKQTAGNREVLLHSWDAFWSDAVLGPHEEAPNNPLKGFPQRPPAL